MFEKKVLFSSQMIISISVCGLSWPLGIWMVRIYLTGRPPGHFVWNSTFMISQLRSTCLFITVSVQSKVCNPIVDLYVLRIHILLLSTFYRSVVQFNSREVMILTRFRGINLGPSQFTCGLDFRILRRRTIQWMAVGLAPGGARPEQKVSLPSTNNMSVRSFHRCTCYAVQSPVLRKSCTWWTLCSCRRIISLKYFAVQHILFPTKHVCPTRHMALENTEYGISKLHTE